VSASESRVVETQIRLAVGPETIFPYLVEADRYARWQGVRAELDPRPGGSYRVWMDEAMVAVGEFIEVIPPRRVAFTWGWENDPEVPPGSTTVEIELEAEGDGTLLTLRHSGLPTAAAALLHEEGWRFFTDRLATVLAGRDPGPMPDRPGS
jgi:uncharacterized protein YndB with AHSA1/START domain